MLWIPIYDDTVALIVPIAPEFLLFLNLLTSNLLDVWAWESWAFAIASCCIALCWYNWDKLSFLAIAPANNDASSKINACLKYAGKLANDLGLTNTNVVESFTDNVKGFTDNAKNNFTGFNTIGTKGPKDPTDDRGNGDGGNEKNALLSEYISLLQRMEQGMLSAEEQGRFNSLKSRLGKAQGGIMNVNMNKGKLGVMNG